METVRKEGEWVRAWGYNFQWTHDHLTPEQMRPMMFSYDALATECLDRLDELAPQKSFRSRQPAGPKPQDASPREAAECPLPDLYSLLQQHAPSDPSLQRLLSEVNTIPPWVDWAQLARGQKVFYRYAGPSIVSLTFQSLLGGMGSHRIVETLTRTGGFSVPIARRRLLETFSHILSVTSSLPSIQPGGHGFTSTLRVRLLHASVRRRILRLTTSSPSYYPTSTLGVPISDLESLATILSFSAALIWIGFPRQGIYLRPDEVADYLALWRYTAHLIGAPTSHLATPALAKAALESLIASEIEPSETSKILANNIIASLKEQEPTYASADFLRAEAHWLNGRELADALGVPRPGWWYMVLVGMQCLAFMSMCYVRRSFAGWDERTVERLRGSLRDMATRQLGGREAVHGFSYVPEIGKTTVGEEGGGGGGGGKRTWFGVSERSLVVMGVVMGVGWVCFGGMLREIGSGSLKARGLGFGS